VFQRLVGIIFGAIVAFLLLLLFHNGRLISDERSGFLIAVAAGDGPGSSTDVPIRSRQRSVAQ
jgi:hypothetical protein